MQEKKDGVQNDAGGAHGFRIKSGMTLSAPGVTSIGLPMDDKLIFYSGRRVSVFFKKIIKGFKRVNI